MQVVRATFILGLLATPAAAEYVKVSDDLTIHYEVAGSGPQTVLFVPGWTMNSEVFEKQLAHFAESKDYRLIVIDPRSQGLTTKTFEGNFYEQHGRDLDAFVTKLNLNHFVLGGWSNGGFDILSYVHQFGSGKLDGLVMIDAAPSGRVADSTKEWGWFRRDDSDGYLEYFTQGALLDREKLNDEFAHWMVTNATPEYLKWINRVTNMTGDGVAALLNTSSYYQEYSADLKALDGKIPLLYVSRAEWKDVVTNWAAQNTPSATVAVMDKHLSFWETPDQFEVPLDAFLTELAK
jgi:non-heme chloroperoxidase